MKHYLDLLLMKRIFNGATIEELKKILIYVDIQDVNFIN